MGFATGDGRFRRGDNRVREALGGELPRADCTSGQQEVQRKLGKLLFGYGDAKGSVRQSAHTETLKVRLRLHFLSR